MSTARSINAFDETYTELDQALAGVYTESGQTLLALTRTSPVLLVFLRHFGCAFCRQAISDIADLHPKFDARGVRPVFVHLGTPEAARPYFDYYHLETVERISNPDATLYRHPVFHLPRRHPAWQLVDPRVWYGWLRGPLFKHGVGSIKEDGHQMPGIFFLKNGKIVRAFHYKTVADQPKYLRLIA